MSRLVSRAENFERVYTAFQNINFAAFDYDTVKQSLLDYVKLYFPETFNDYIESSEFIAIIESFAYIAELLAYRLDVNAHENFISTAQRRDSVLRLAKLVSYKADRIFPARGLMKLTSISTTENIIDANGIDLTNTTVRWNDVTNTNWKDQFILIMNRVLDQEFGTVTPSDRFQIQNVLFEIYAWDLNPLPTGVFPFGATVNGQSIPMELVPVAFDSSLQSVVERRPENNTNFTFLYGTDGLGDASDTTGFFCFAKQGTLQKFITQFDGITPNQTYDVPQVNTNETDVWVNNVDPTTGVILDLPSLLPYHRPINVRSGEWAQVDIAHAQNVIFNTNPLRSKYEVETLDNDQVRLIFGDGEFADIPKGTFNVWARTSLNQDIVIPQASVTNMFTSFTYTDSFGRTQTFTFTFSLIGSLQNASASETIDHIRVTAPAVYYTQDRMVNAEDYNVFPLQDSSILKLRSINRTFAGDSKYISWHDPSSTYENVKMFGDDGLIYFEDTDITTTTPSVDYNTLITTYIEPLLSSTDIFLQLVSNGVSISDIRRTFLPVETARIVTALTPPPSPSSIQLFWNKVTNEWYAVKSTDDPVVFLAPDYPTNYIEQPLIVVNQINISQTIYNVTRAARRIIAQSQTTRFWNNNDGNQIIEFDTLDSDLDIFVILKANPDNTRNALMSQNWEFNILGLESIISGPQLGLPDINRVDILSVDVNGDSIPDNLTLANIINPTVIITVVGSASLPIYYIGGKGDITVVGDINPMVQGTHWNEDVDTLNVGNSVNIISMNGNTTVTITVKDYVYFTRLTLTESWIPQPTSYESITSFISDELGNSQLWKRNNGRDALNFAWFHRSPRYHLIDPAASNIIDMFIITKGYFTQLKRWLADPLTPQPDVPTPLSLRTSYASILQNKMVSDTVVLHPGKIKLLFGSHAPAELQAMFKIIRSTSTTVTDNQIKSTTVTTIRNFFDITTWEFGETFFFTELSAAIHAALPTEISSVVIVPTLQQNQFGDMFEVLAREDEIFYADVTVDDIDIVTSYNAINLRLNG